MVKAVLVYISREGCGYCTMFEKEWATIKDSNPSVLYRQYKVPQTQVPAPLAAYEKWYPILVLVPYMSYLQAMSVGADGRDTVNSTKTITDAVVFNGIVVPSGGSVKVEYSNPGKTMATVDTVNAWVTRSIQSMPDDGTRAPSSGTAVAPTATPSAPVVVPQFGGGRLPTVGSRYRSPYE